MGLNAVSDYLENLLNVLSRDFLARTAQEHGLSPEQEEVFLLRFAENQSYEAISKEIGISKDACLKRMAQVYKKMDIKGETRGKENRLRTLMLRCSRKESMPALESDDLGLVGEANSSEFGYRVQQQYRLLSDLRNNSEVSATAHLLDTPHVWLQALKEELEFRGVDYSQPALNELLSLLPKAIERTAARSHRTEFDLVNDILDKVISILLDAGAEVFVNRGDCRFSLGEAERAIEDYTLAIRCNSKFASAYYGRAFAYSSLRETRHAIDDFDLALRLSL